MLRYAWLTELCFGLVYFGFCLVLLAYGLESCVADEALPKGEDERGEDERGVTSNVKEEVEKECVVGGGVGGGKDGQVIGGQENQHLAQSLHQPIVLRLCIQRPYGGGGHADLQ